jgi:orotidine-5'-phosphate decarboxylase
VFVLVKTSNPSSGDVQDVHAADGTVAEAMARLVSGWGGGHLAKCGLSAVGAVVGATYPEQARRLRELMPDTIFLVPGYGAQGGSAADIAAAFRDDGTGAIVNSSRGIIAAFQPDEPRWEWAVENATRAAIDGLSRSTPMGLLRR